MLPALDAEGVDLLKCLLKYDPKERITAAEAVRHPWLADAALEVPERAAAGMPAADGDKDSPLSDETQIRDVPDGDLSPLLHDKHIPSAFLPICGRRKLLGCSFSVHDVWLHTLTGTVKPARHASPSQSAASLLNHLASLRTMHGEPVILPAVSSRLNTCKRGESADVPSDGADAVRGVGDRNADMELAELADVLPAENNRSNWGELGLASARGSAEPPESAVGSSPLQDLPASSAHQQNGAESPGLSHPVSRFIPFTHPCFLAVVVPSFACKCRHNIPLARGRTCMPTRIKANVHPFR